MKKGILVLIPLIVFCWSISAQVVTIGNQHWMTKNLNVSTFRNGDPIREARTNHEWKEAIAKKEPAWCYYENNPKNGAKYGKIYNWYAVSDPRGLAPYGWHIPSFMEWNSLVKHGWHRTYYTTMQEIRDARFGPEKEYLSYKKGLSQKSINKLGKLQGGKRTFGGFVQLRNGGGGCFWWTSTLSHSQVGYYASSHRENVSWIEYDGRRVSKNDVRTIGPNLWLVNEGEGFYVLCVNDRIENQIPTDNF
jgi:uncharacterized protein (TIGR02145 family)